MFKKIKKIKYLLILSFLITPLYAWAGLNTAFENSNKSNLGIFGKSSGIYKLTPQPEAYIGSLLTGLFSILGIISVALLIYSGFIWMTARGNESKVEEAKENISNILIGLIFIIGSYALTTILLKIFA